MKTLNEILTILKCTKDGFLNWLVEVFYDSI